MPLPPPAFSGPKAWCVDHDCEVYASDPAHKFCDLLRGTQKSQRGVRSMGYSELPNERMPRLLSGFDSVDRFIGDRVSGDIGWVWNSVAILGGPTGSGKSTLLTHLADGFARSTGARKRRTKSPRARTDSTRRTPTSTSSSRPPGKRCSKRSPPSTPRWSSSTRRR